MKIGIMADTHDNLPAVAKAVSVFNDAEVSLVIHAGDLVAPFVSRPLKELKSEFVAVFGNNDGEKFGLKDVFGEKIHRPPYPFNYMGKKILVLHEPDNIEILRSSGYFDLIVYGHTHEIDIRKGRSIVINPGECGGWLYGKRTVAIFDFESGDVLTTPV